MSINMIKRLMLSALMIGASALFADTNTTSCTVTEEVLHQPIGDQSGKIVVTQKKVYRECVDQTTIRGECIQWDEATDKFKISNYADVAKQEITNNANIADAMTIFQAVSQASHMFNGVRGRCIYGTLQDYSWLQDPMFYAGLLMDYLGSDQFQNSYVNEYQDASGTVKSADEAIKEGTKTLNEGFTVAPKYDAFAQVYTAYGDYAICAVTAAADMAGSVADFYNEDTDCDPVDEFCGADNGGIDDPGLVETLTLAEYDAMIAKDPTIKDYLEIIDDGSSSGYVTFRIIESAAAELDDSKTQKEIEAAREEAKLKQMQLKITIASAKAAACVGGAAFDNNSQANQPGGAAPAASAGLNMAVNQFIPWPYNTLASVALKMFDSYQSVDSCADEDDANMQGKRHVIAYRGLRFKTCHENKHPEVIGEVPVVGTPMLWERDMCCYDSPMTKILMAQMHAQVGRGWAHCTGISLNEMAHISWRQCSASEMADGFDGAYILGVEGADYSMKDSFQYKHQCMDLGEFRDYVQSQIPANYDDNQVTEMLEHMTQDMRDSLQ